jgi:diadenylate cyclase
MEQVISAIEYINRFWTPLRELLQFLIQVGLLTVIIYTVLLFLKGTRAEPILIGIVITILGGWILSQAFGLEVIEWIIAKLPALMVFALLIIFQPEIRSVFAEIGVNPHRLISTAKTKEETINALIHSAYSLAEKKIGALITIERDIGMRPYTEAGVKINAPVSSELLSTIFFPNTPLHDGAVVIKNGIILSAACFFPLTQSELGKSQGTRHRAGVGITEETDAVSIIVSEEEGFVSLAHKGRLVRNINAERLRRHLLNYLVKKDTTASALTTKSKDLKAQLTSIVKSLPAIKAEETEKSS